MSSTVTGSQGSGPRYAPEDPTLPKPWKGLVDGSTGYLYYWNPATNVTQYERPVVEEQLPPPPPFPRLAPLSSVQVHQNLNDDDRRSQIYPDEDGRSRNHQHEGARISGVRTGLSSADVGHVSSGANSHLHSSIPATVSIRNRGSFDSVVTLSAEAYRRHHEITVTGDEIPAPYMTFELAGLSPEILKEVQRAGFPSPTPIQAQSWPIALHGRDIVAIAKTGSGKTIGYLFPGFVHLKHLRNNPKMGPTVLVLSPTRELATQIQDEAEKFGRSSRISCTCLYGGAPKGPQLRDLDRGVDIVVATPGRLNDIMEMKRISLRQVSYLVLDEADRMLDMGFEPQIRKIVKEVPQRRQTLMFTATWPKEVRKIAADLLVNPIQVNIGSIDALVANKAITQYVELIKPVEKLRRLEQILKSQETGSKIIIFCTTKRMCDQLARSLVRQFGAAAIHGDKSQVERDRVLSQFKSGRSPILVATDVAARGLDIKDIRVVINYDFPTGVEDYVHRIGRTGRAGATGVSYTFFSDQDFKYALELVKVLEGADQKVPPELRDMAARGGYGGKSRRWASCSDTRDRARLGAARNDFSSSARRSGHPPPSLARVDTTHHDRSNHGDRYSRANGRAIDRYAGNEAKGMSRGRSRSYSSSPTRRGHGVLGSGRSRSRSRSKSLDKSRSRSRSHSIGRNNGRPSPPSKRKVKPSDHKKRRESSRDRYRGCLSPSPRRERSADHHHGRSPPPKRDDLTGRHHFLSPQSKRPPSDGLNSADDGADRSRIPSSANGDVSRISASRASSRSPHGQMTRSPFRQITENGTQPDGQRLYEREGGMEPEELFDGPARLTVNGEEEEEGLIQPYEVEGTTNLKRVG